MSNSAYDILVAFRVPTRTTWYTIGYGESRVTVRSQQIRALNLAWALSTTGTLPVGAKVVVVGGGAAGLTVAAALAIKGMSVTVLEQARQLLPLQRNCHKRHLHPHVFDWPDATADNTRADLPILDWSAGPARDVALEIEDGFREVCSRYPGSLEALCGVADIQVESPASGHVTFRLDRPNKRESRRFDAIIFALGFGVDSPPWVGQRGSYWADDSLEQHGVMPRGTYLVSGTGDGALIDLLRLLLPELNQPGLVRLLRSSMSKYAEFTAWIADVEIRLAQLAVGGPSDSGLIRDSQSLFLYESYASFDPNEFGATNLRDEIKRYLNERLSVTLVTRDPSPFSTRARPLHRFYLSRLLFDFPSHIDLRCNTEIGAKSLIHRDAGVLFDYGGTIEDYQQAVVRHGPQPLQIYAGFPLLRELLSSHNPKKIDPKPLYSKKDFGAPKIAYRGASGPTLADYFDQLWGRGYLTETIQGRVPLSKFRNVALELRRDESGLSEDSDFEQNDDGLSRDEDGSHLQEEQRSTSRRLALSAKRRVSYEREDFNRLKEALRRQQDRAELARIAERRRSAPSLGTPVAPSSRSLDFSFPTFVRGMAGTGKTTFIQHLVHDLLPQVPQLDNRPTFMERPCVIPILVGGPFFVEEHSMDYSRGLAEAALRTVQLGNFSRASVRLEQLLLRRPHSSHQPTIRVFLDTVETFGDELFRSLTRWIVENGHELVVCGRRFPVDPRHIGLNRRPRVYELAGISPGHRSRFLSLHTDEDVDTDLMDVGSAAPPFMLLEWKRAELSLQRSPKSIVEVYQVRTNDSLDGQPAQKLEDLAREMLLRPAPRLSFPRAKLPKEIQEGGAGADLLTGSHYVEFSHLSYGEFLAANSVARTEQLAQYRTELRSKPVSWQHELDVLAMAHALNEAEFVTAVRELADEPDPDVLQLRMILRSMRYSGRHSSVLKSHGQKVIDLVHAALAPASARFGECERDLVRCALEVWQLLVDATVPATTQPLCGEPAASEWALRRVQKSNPRGLVGRPPESSWWTTIYAEARAITQEFKAFEQILECTDGAKDSLERLNALGALGMTASEAMAMPLIWRGHSDGSEYAGEATVHTLGLLATDDPADRQFGWERVGEFVTDPDVLSCIAASIFSNDPDAGVRSIVLTALQGSAEPSRRKTFLDLLQFRKRITWDEQELFGKLLSQFVNAPELEDELTRFVREGCGWFCEDDHWRAILSIEACQDALRERLMKDVPERHDIAAASFLNDCHDRIRVLLAQLLDTGTNAWLIPECIASLPQGDPLIRKRLESCARGIGVTTIAKDVARLIRRRAIESIAHAEDCEPFLLDLLGPLANSDDAGSALLVGRFRNTTGGRDLTKRILLENQFDRDWHNLVVGLLESESDEALLLKIFDVVSIPGQKDEWHLLPYRRAVLTRKLIHRMTPEDIEPMLASPDAQVRAAVYEHVLGDVALAARFQQELVSRALIEQDHNAQRVLWRGLPSNPRVAEHLNRKARADLWPVRRACFALLTETQHGRRELRRLLGSCLEGGVDERILPEIASCLARDPDSIESLRSLLKGGRRAAALAMNLLHDDSILRDTARQMIKDDEWVKQFAMTGVLPRYFEHDDVAGEYVLKRVLDGSWPMALSEAISLLASYPPASDWILAVALESEASDLNASREARRIHRSHPDVVALLRRDLSLPDDTVQGRSAVERACEIAASEPWAADAVASLQKSRDKSTRAAALRAAVKLSRLPTVLGAETGLRDDLERRESEVSIRQLLVESIDSLPIVDVERRRWLAKMATHDHHSDVRRSAAAKLRRAEAQPSLRASTVPQVTYIEEAGSQVYESIDADRFQAGLAWVVRKLVSKLPDALTRKEAPLFVDDPTSTFGEVLAAQDGVTLLRLSKDANELPRDRKIYPAANLVLAWLQASRLVAARPTAVLLACADLHSEELRLAMPQLEPGQVVVGPVYFGFRLRENVPPSCGPRERVLSEAT